MTQTPESSARRQAYRFLLTYREEVGSDAESKPVWRGWAVKVPDGGRSPTDAPPAQVWFQSLDEVPAAIRRLIEMDQAWKPAGGR